MRLTRAQIDRAIARWASATQERVGIVDATRVDLAGRTLPASAPDAGRAVARIERLSLEVVVESLASTAASVDRVFCDLGILEPRSEGLVIVELAPGVSALEVQALVGPTLKIPHDVVEMVLD